MEVAGAVCKIKSANLKEITTLILNSNKKLIVCNNTTILIFK